MYKTNRIQPYAAWLQRLKQESKWSAKDWLKARSYLYRLFSSGQTSKSMYTVVRIDTLLNRLNELNQNLHNMNIKNKIFTVMIEDIERMKATGCEFVLLDGQNRLEYPIKKFFENELQFYFTTKTDKVTKSINFVIDEKKYTKEAFYYKDLKKEEKDLIDNIDIIFPIGGNGEIDEFIEDLMDDNSGESWNDFEMNVTKLKTINYLVNTALDDKGTPSFLEVLKRTGKMDGAYHVEKKGYHKFIQELVQYEYNGNLTLDYEVILDETKADKLEKAFYQVENFFKALTQDKTFAWTYGTKHVFASKEHLRNLYTIMQILKSGATGDIINLDDILSMHEIFTDYEKFDTFKRDRVKNKDEFIPAAGGGEVPLPNTWIWAQKDIKTEVLNLRKSILTSFVEEHIQGWKDKNVFKRLDSSEVNPVVKKRVILNADKNPYSVYGKKLNRFVDDLHVDHKEQFNRGGSNEESNLTAVVATSNLKRSK